MRRSNKKNYSKFSDTLVKLFNSFNDSPNESIDLFVNLSHMLLNVINITLNKLR